MDNPAETWDPARLDLLLGVLGSDEAPGYNGARCAQLIHWSPGVWEALQSRLGAADAITGDPFMDTWTRDRTGRGRSFPVQLRLSRPTRARRYGTEKSSPNLYSHRSWMQRKH